MAFELPIIMIDALLGVSYLVEAIGVLIIIFAIAHSTYRIARIEIFHDKRFHQYEHTKRTLIQKIIFALDFFVSADLIRLVVLSDFNDILTVAVIVAVRTVLSWSLSREIHLHKEK
ncbi:MAG: DUF1622 domain-containing protein [Candidatus Micrarchaeota archaeon]